MKIIDDNIIFSLQKAGGISAYWSELLKRADAKNSTFYGKNRTNILIIQNFLKPIIQYISYDINIY